MKSSGFFVFGVLCGVIGTVIFERWREEHDSEDVELLSKRVGEHLKQLEDRLETALNPSAK